MQTDLSKLLPNESGVVISVTNTGNIRRRLLDMGITPGVEIFMRKTAPFGDPIEISLRGYSLSLRKAEAKQIIVTKTDRSALL